MDHCITLTILFTLLSSLCINGMEKKLPAQNQLSFFRHASLSAIGNDEYYRYDTPLDEARKLEDQILIAILEDAIAKKYAQKK